MIQALLWNYIVTQSIEVIAKMIERIIEENRVGDERGPQIWLSPKSRSLVGKEKQGTREPKIRTFKEKNKAPQNTS